MIARLIAKAQKVKITINIWHLQAIVIACSPLCVLATVTDFNDQFNGYTPFTLFSLGSLIFCGTLSGMLHRLKNEYQTNGKVLHPLLFVSSDLVGGVLAGGMMVMVGFGNNFPNWLVAVCTGSAAFAGSLLIEQGWQSLAKRYLPSNPDSALSNIIGKATHNEADPPAPPEGKRD